MSQKLQLQQGVVCLNAAELKTKLGGKLPKHMKSVPAIKLPKRTRSVADIEVGEPQKPTKKQKKQQADAEDDNVEAQDDDDDHQTLFCFLPEQDEARKAVLISEICFGMETTEVATPLWEGHAEAVFCA